MHEFRNKPFLRANYKRHKIEVRLIIEYNALFPALDFRGDPVELSEEKARSVTRSQAIDLTIDPDFSSQIRDGHSVRVVDVRIEEVKDLEV